MKKRTLGFKWYWFLSPLVTGTVCGGIGLLYLVLGRPEADIGFVPYLSFIFAGLLAAWVVVLIALRADAIPPLWFDVFWGVSLLVLLSTMGMLRYLGVFNFL